MSISILEALLCRIQSLYRLSEVDDWSREGLGNLLSISLSDNRFKDPDSGSKTGTR